MKLGRSHIRSHARSHDNKSCDYGVTIAFFFGVNSHKQVIVKSYLQPDQKLFNSIGETRGKTNALINVKNLLAP